MTYLLDTHTLLWTLQQPDLLGEGARQVLAGTEKDEESRILVSPVSAYEVAYKVARGKWPEAKRLADNFEQALFDTQFQLAPVTITASIRAGRLADQHRDPFDRLLAATAIELDIPLISTDPAFDTFGVRRIW